MHPSISQVIPLAASIFAMSGVAETTSAQGLIDAALEALGGREALTGLSGVTYEYPEFVLYDTRRVMFY